jgi:hypothetical protein
MLLSVISLARLACGQHIIFSYDDLWSTYCFLMHICLMPLSVGCIKQDSVYRLDAFPCVSAESVSCYINFEESGHLGYAYLLSPTIIFLSCVKLISTFFIPALSVSVILFSRFCYGNPKFLMVSC